eukprot:TRINITY_DN72732_c0_g1_i1.p1 TRINITY_DN72732_c0_g1~~TRINITY_DN72732_c0_g1_i1.p1  ORF type:complete len:181 (+),score=16.33 TRINITY_DN72732_c0_g1_i1:56-598(+)
MLPIAFAVSLLLLHGVSASSVQENATNHEDVSTRGNLRATSGTPSLLLQHAFSEQEARITNGDVATRGNLSGVAAARDYTMICGVWWDPGEQDNIDVTFWAHPDRFKPGKGGSKVDGLGMTQISKGWWHDMCEKCRTYKVWHQPDTDVQAWLKSVGVPKQPDGTYGRCTTNAFGVWLVPE